MRKAFKGLAVAAAMLWAGSAQAAIVLQLSGDITHSEGRDAPEPYEELRHLVVSLTADDWDADRFFLGTNHYSHTGVYCAPVQADGTGCMAPSIFGNSVIFTAPEYRDYYATYNITLNFDRPLAHLKDISSANFLGGSIHAGVGREQYFVSDYGDISWFSVPEPASWAMMLAGFGLIGRALRKVRPLPAPAR